MSETPRYPVHTGFMERILKGIGALSAGGAANLLFQIVVVPVAIGAWGEVKYGEWLVLSGLVAFLKLSDLGIQTHVVNRFCAAYARGDREEFRRDFHAALRIQMALVGIVFLCAAGLVWTIPLRELLEFRTTSGLDLHVAAVFLVAELLLSIPLGIVAGVYRATGRLARGAVIAAIQRLGVLALTVTLVLNHVLFATLAAGRLALTLALGVWIVRDVLRLDPWIRDRNRDGSWRLGLSMIAPGLLFLLVPIADYLSTRVVTFIIQRASSGAEVSRFVTHRTVANFPRMGGNFLAWALWPELTALGAVGERERLRRLYSIATERGATALGVTCLVMLPFLSWVYPLWTSGRLRLDPWAMGLLLLETMVWGAWNVSTTFLLALNRQHFVGLVLFFGAAVTTGTALLLVPRWPTLGGAIAVLLGSLAGPAWLLPTLASRVLGISPFEFGATLLRAASKVLLIPLAGAIACQLAFSNMVLRAAGGGAFAALAVLFFWRSLSDAERIGVKQALGTLRGRFVGSARRR